MNMYNLCCILEYEEKLNKNKEWFKFTNYKELIIIQQVNYRKYFIGLSKEEWKLLGLKPISVIEILRSLSVTFLTF